MRAVSSARYAFNGSIVAVIDGQTLGVPDDPANMDRLLIGEWEVGGGQIAPYVAPPEPVPDAVSARQFKLQLLASGLLDQVEAFIASQGKAVQIAYDNSNAFVRTEPMMASGFAALGFSQPQIDAFFVAASKI